MKLGQRCVTLTARAGKFTGKEIKDAGMIGELLRRDLSYFDNQDIECFLLTTSQF